MENYYKQKADLEVTKERLNSLLEVKEQIYVKYFGTTSKIKEVVSHSNDRQDKVPEYLIELEEKGISKEIESLLNQVRIKKYHLRKMEHILSQLEGVEYDFIKLRYYEEHNYTLEQIADKLGYSLDRIKQISSKMEKEIENKKEKITL